MKDSQFGDTPMPAIPFAVPLPRLGISRTITAIPPALLARVEQIAGF